jgi:hypothetical protein
VADIEERPRSRSRTADVIRGGIVVSFGPGCHDGSFFAAQQPPSLAFLAARLS